MKKNERLAVFVFQPKSARCDRKRLHRALVGQVAPRLTKNEFGEMSVKNYTYPGALTGIWHERPIPGVIVVRRKDAGRVEGVFKKYGVDFTEFRSTLKNQGR